MPINRIKSLSEVQLKDDSRGTSLVAALDNLNSINKILSNTTTFDEPGLIRVHKMRNKRLQAERHTLGTDLGDTILQGDRSVVFGQEGGSFLRQEGKLSLVDTFKVSCTRMEGIQEGKKIMLY